jgi:hypothetical protein
VTGPGRLTIAVDRAIVLVERVVCSAPFGFACLVVLTAWFVHAIAPEGAL